MNENTKPQEDQKTKNSITTDVAELLNKHPWLGKLAFGLLTLSSGAFAGFIAAHSFIEKEVTKAAEERLKPYESLFSGLSLNSGEEYIAAAETFRDLLNSKKFEGLPPRIQDLAYDGMLFAISNSEKPKSFQPEITKITSRLAVKVEETPWRLHNLGWYYLRIGDNKNAKEYLRKAKDSFESQREYISSTDPMRGLIIAALLDGNIDEAIAIGESIKLRNPSRYRDNSDLTNEIQQIQKERTFDLLNARHGEEIQKAIKKYTETLRTKSHQKPNQETTN